ncbi:MAG: NAD(P)-binding domain-containing protein [Gammaproteobacteria bacterium]|nr:NAD(P)-binding domain-containing protein [Gammaproteobacteria bacterium]MDH4315793.1 NAD(P)-binding domain-containing protein [Gammaproteobacteria bacterium]MDH5214731.1 NAD(P)-binding domain-containing protein [Gammaproteobacteria bacterium]
MDNHYLLILYALPIMAILILYARSHSRKERQNQEVLLEAHNAGLIEPPSLHPEIDPTICVGCKSCVAACPEQPAHRVLGMINNKARLIGPSDCIGHGACKTACPVGAIKLVFGTATRGIDLPVVKPDFETDVPGLFIAGELGGMGLIRNAVEQGRQAMDSIERIASGNHSCDLDVVVVGAGPAGISATLGAKAKKLRYATIEQDSLGGTVAHFPRRKLVMTQPAELPIVGMVKFKEVSKETLIEFWQEVVKKTGLKIHYGERVDAIDPIPGGGFTVKTTAKNYKARAVLLSIGRRGTPRTLGVPGEDLPKVVYRLIDPEQYRNMHVLVVGGGDSALEAATTISDEPGTTVTLSYRSDAFSRAKQKNRQRAETAVGDGRLKILYSSNVRCISKDSVTIAIGQGEFELPNDAVIVSAGGILPTAFLKKAGINVVTKWGQE